MEIFGIRLILAPQRSGTPAKRVAAILTASAALLLAACAQKPKPSLPSDIGPFPAEWAQEPVILLADSSVWTVIEGPDGNRLERRAVAWYRVNRRNPALLASLVFHDDETTETPPAIRVDAYYADGATWGIDEKSLERTRARAAGMLSTNGFEQTVRLPRYAEGMLIRCETRQTILKPEFRSREILRGEFPCLRRYASFRQPVSHGHLAEVRNGEKLALDTAFTVTSGYRELRVTGGPLPRLKPFNRQRYPEEWYAGIHFSVAPAGPRPLGWAELGDRYLALISADSAAADPAVRALADSLGSGGPDTLAERAFALLGNRIRYLADEESMNAFIPRPPATILANGYGDCKEMANLMRALLRAKGVETGLALVRTAGHPQLLAEFPSLAAFNHMVLWRRTPEGAVLCYDPTVPAARPDASCLPLVAQKALLLAPGASAVDTLEPFPGYRNRAVTTSRFEPRAEGKGWTLRGTVALKGRTAFELAMALRYRHIGKEESRSAVWSFLSGNFGIQASDWEWRVAAGDSLEIGWSMPADQLVVGLGSGGVKLDVPALMGMEIDDAEFEGDRHYSAFEQEDSWTLPPGYKQLQRHDLATGPANGKWASAKGEVRRSFRCEGMVWRSGEKAGLSRFLDAVSAFSLASVWR